MLNYSRSRMTCSSATKIPYPSFAAGMIPISKTEAFKCATQHASAAYHTISCPAFPRLETGSHGRLAALDDYLGLTRHDANKRSISCLCLQRLSYQPRSHPKLEMGSLASLCRPPMVTIVSLHRPKVRLPAAMRHQDSRFGILSRLS